MHTSTASAAARHTKNTCLYRGTLHHKCTCTFKLCRTNDSKHLNCTFPILRTARVIGSINLRMTSELTSALHHAKKSEQKQTFTDFQHIKLLQEVPKEIVWSRTVGLMAPLITGQGCSCCAAEGQGLLSGRQISHWCPLRPPLECRQRRGRKHKKAACA